MVARNVLEFRAGTTETMPIYSHLGSFFHGGHTHSLVQHSSVSKSGEVKYVLGGDRGGWLGQSNTGLTPSRPLLVSRVKAKVNVDFFNLCTFLS